jgi:hypothetical protein
MPGIMPFMPRISLPMPPLLRLLHHLLRLLELVEQAIHFLHLHPAPVAIRRLRLALINSGLARSAGVIELMMPSTRPTILFSAPAGN